MATVNSVLGPIDTADLGFTLMHEHLLVSSAGVVQNYPELLGEGFIDRLASGLIRAKEGGVTTIVDATTIDLGRDANVLAEASRRSGVNIIACTGWWMEIPRFIRSVTADQFAQLFVREIEEGIAGTGIKAGIIKSASDSSGVQPEEEKILRGAARAHKQTGLPLMLHSYSPGQVGRQQMAILKEEGVELSRVKFDHSNDTTDVEYLTWILEQGCYLGMDRYPGRSVTSEERTNTMKALIDAGYVDRLLPSHDHSLVSTMGAASAATPRPEPGTGYLHVKNVVLPQLREMGVDEATVNRLCVEGPRRFVEGVSQD